MLNAELGRLCLILWFVFISSKNIDHLILKMLMFGRHTAIF